MLSRASSTGLSVGRRRNATAGAIPRARAHALASMAGFACLLLSSSAWGHVAFSTPDADTEVLIGTSVELTWRDTISHNTLGYHLDFYRDPLGEPLRVASDLPPTQQ